MQSLSRGRACPLAQHHLVEGRQRLDQRSEKFGGLFGRQDFGGVEFKDLRFGGFGLPHVFADQPASIVRGLRVLEVRGTFSTSYEKPQTSERRGLRYITCRCPLGALRIPKSRSQTGVLANLGWTSRGLPV